MFNYLGNGGFPAESPALSHINVFCEIDFGNVIIVLGGGGNAMVKFKNLKLCEQFVNWLIFQSFS